MSRISAKEEALVRVTNSLIYDRIIKGCDFGLKIDRSMEGVSNISTSFVGCSDGIKLKGNA